MQVLIFLRAKEGKISKMEIGIQIKSKFTIQVNCLFLYNINVDYSTLKAIFLGV